MSLRNAAPRPVLHRVAPSYPRALAIGAILLAGCGGVVDPGSASNAASNADATPETTTPMPQGTSPVVFDSGADAPDTNPPDPPPAGDIAYPYDDAGQAPDAAADSAIDSDPSFGGGAPAPFDAADLPVDPSDPNAPLDGGAAPSP